MTEWFADETFWETFYLYMFSEEQFELAEEQVEKILALLDLNGGSVLDLACGPGRHSVALAKRGFTVTGVDLSPFLLSKARELAEAEGVQIEWVQQDMRAFSRPGAFNLCLSMFTSFGYFENKQDDVSVLRNIHASLAKSGVCLIDVSGKEGLARRFQPTSAREMEDGSLVIERREVRDDWSRIRDTWIMLKDGMAREFRFEHTVYSAQELKDRLAEAGFSKVEVFGNLDGAEYGIEAARLICVGRK